MSKFKLTITEDENGLVFKLKKDKYKGHYTEKELTTEPDENREVVFFASEVYQTMKNAFDDSINHVKRTQN